MRRINLFLTLTIISLVSLVAVAAAGYIMLTAPTASSNNPSNWAGQMWGGMGNMMGGNPTATAQTNSAAGYFGIAFVALIAVAVVGVGGLVYFFAFPEIRTARGVSPVSATPNIMAAAPTASAAMASPAKSPEPETSPLDSVVKTLTADERKVVAVLTAHGGKYLQKYIRNETGFSRLQTHRIVARLAERGIVSLEKTGNTNTVLLENWLK